MIERILNLLARIPQDKVGHFAVCTVLALVGLLVGKPLGLALLGSILLPIGAAAWKEAYDRTHPPHAFDLMDFAAGLLGAAPVWITWWLK